MTWRLKRTKQCAKCPWRVSTDPRQIPNNYSEDLHRGLASTIAEPASTANLFGPMRAMACHESGLDGSEEEPCVGWLAQQLGPGNNLALRMRMMSCENAGDIQLLGEQHDTFEATLPEGEGR